jgi:oligopeptide/dipeptide ABC transporter ATP-binding protein
VSALLEVRGLSVAFASGERGPRGSVTAVDGLDLALGSGETLALVGESGCGKTLSALAVMGLLPPSARVTRGQILFRGLDLLRLAPDERRALCGRELAMSFQEPASALNPVLTVGEQVAEPLRHHAGLSRAAAWTRACDLLSEVGLEDADERAERYPHELSGGQRQRVMLAMALACGPSLLIADEPTSALDAPVQAEILRLFAELRERREMALLLITHDLAVVAELADRVAVMYAGRVVEEAPVLELFEEARHPYTHGLLRSRPSALLAGEPLRSIPGGVPAPGAWPSGCRFHPRCPLADEVCAREVPRLLAALRPRGGALGSRDAGSSDSDPLRPSDASLEVVHHRTACHHAGEPVP